MTDVEMTIQSHLDAHPSDAVARQVLADHLEERGDPRGEGYRAMGGTGRHPYFTIVGWSWGTYRVPYRAGYEPDRSDLPDDWYAAARTAAGSVKETVAPLGAWFSCHTRREADDAAAMGWSRLSPEQQRAILTAAGVLT